jgi:protein TonB
MQAESYEPQIDLAALESNSHVKRRRPAFGALVLVLAVFALIVVKYRTSWFDSLSFNGASAETSSSASDGTAPSAAAHTPSRKGTVKQRVSSVPDSTEEAAAPSSLEAVAVVPPPLRVEVRYSNGRHQVIRARDASIHLSFSPETADALVLPKDPVYPLSAQEKNVQGAVELMASIAKDGSVVSVQVLSGPDVLAKAAVEAIKQWRFKPRDQAGQSAFVETPITVNFTISTP